MEVDVTMQRVEKSVRIAAPVEQAYQYWRDFTNYPNFMEHVESVTVTDESGRLSHWKLKGPLGTAVEFDAERVRDEPNSMIGWNATGGDMTTSGVVTFADMGGTTDVHVTMQWADPPGGALGEAASKVLQDPDKMLEEDLQRFKDIVEGRVGSGLRR
jgi:uncharacterized membrane protein